MDRIDRKAILAAMKARPTYAATGNLIVETSMGSHFMGAAFSGAAPPAMNVKVRGTGPLELVELIRSNRVV